MVAETARYYVIGIRKIDRRYEHHHISNWIESVY